MSVMSVHTFFLNTSKLAKVEAGSLPPKSSEY